MGGLQGSDEVGPKKEAKKMGNMTYEEWQKKSPKEQIDFFDRSSDTFLQEKIDFFTTMNPRLKLLIGKLEEIAPNSILAIDPREPFPYLEELIQEGKVFTVESRLQSARERECHDIVIEACLKDPQRYQWIAGYALGPADDLWRHHSWVLDKGDPKETTRSIRRKYFGIALDLKETFKKLQMMGIKSADDLFKFIRERR